MEQDTTGKCNVLVVMGDGRYGSMFERFLCQMHIGDFNLVVGLVDVRYKGTCRSSKVLSASLQELPENCIVEYMDFERFYAGPGDELNSIFQHYQVDWLCLLPFGNTFHEPQHVERFLVTYKKNRGRNVLLLSSVGAESARVPIGDLKACEDILRTHFPTMNCVLRMQCLLEDLDYFSEAVKHEKTWKLSCGDGSFAPVAFRDDVIFAAAVVMRSKTIDKGHAGQIFTLTGNRAINGITLAEMTSVAFYERDVKFTVISSEEARTTMEREIEKRKKRKDTNLDADTNDGVIGGIDIEYTSHVELEMIINRFEMVKDHHLNVVTPHVRDLTGHAPVTVPAYLRSHEDLFKGGKLCLSPE